MIFSFKEVAFATIQQNFVYFCHICNFTLPFLGLFLRFLFKITPSLSCCRVNFNKDINSTEGYFTACSLTVIHISCNVLFLNFYQLEKGLDVDGVMILNPELEFAVKQVNLVHLPRLFSVTHFNIGGSLSRTSANF